MQERLKLSSLKDKIWYVVPSCATTGEGLFEGLVSWNPREAEWLLQCGFCMLMVYIKGWLSNNVKTPPQRQQAR